MKWKLQNEPNAAWPKPPCFGLFIPAIGSADSKLSCLAIALATADVFYLFTYLCVLCVALWQKIFLE